MPQELKGDRSYHEILRRMGVKNPGEVRVQNPVVLTAQVDDLTRNIAPLANNFYLAGRLRGSVVASRAGAYFVSPGCWMLRTTVEQEAHIWTLDTTPPVMANLTQFEPFFFGGEASTRPTGATMFTCNDIDANYPRPAGSHYWFPSTLNAQPFIDPVYLPPGRVLWWEGTTDNQTLHVCFQWTELPPAPPEG